MSLGEIRDRLNSSLEQFLQIYKEETCLWKISSQDYHNKKRRDESYERLAVKLRELDPGAGIEAVQRKINSLRSNFRRELKKVRAARAQGKTYTPQLWYYKRLEFLKPEIARNPVQGRRNPHNSNWTNIPTDDESDPKSNTSEEFSCASALPPWTWDWEPHTVVSEAPNPPADPLTMVKKESSVDLQDSPDTSSKEAPKRVGNSQDEEESRRKKRRNQYTDDEEERRKRVRRQYLEDEEEEERRRRSQYSEDEEEERRQRNEYSDDDYGNIDESRDVDAGREDEREKEKEEDQFDLFARLMAMKLRDLPREKRIVAQKLINDALFLGELGTLTPEHSIVRAMQPSNPQ